MVQPVHVCASTGARRRAIRNGPGRIPRRPESHHRPWWSNCCRGASVRRYYDPTPGQFLSVDPAVDVTGTPYAFTSGDPVNELDPLGLGCGIFAVVCDVGHAVVHAADAARHATANFVDTHKTDLVIGAGIALGAVSFGAGALAAGALLGADVGVSAGALGAAAFVTGLGAAGLDAPTCFSKSASETSKVAACIGTGSGVFGAVLGGVSLLAPEAELSGYFAAYGAAFAGGGNVVDVLNAFGVFGRYSHTLQTLMSDNGECGNNLI